MQKLHIMTLHWTLVLFSQLNSQAEYITTEISRTLNCMMTSSKILNQSTQWPPNAFQQVYNFAVKWAELQDLWHRI